MGYLTKRFSQFRGINRSRRPGALDLEHAYIAENVDLDGGMMSNKIGSYRCVYDQDVEAIGRPNFLYVGSSDIYLIARDIYTKLMDYVIVSSYSRYEQGKFEPKTNQFSPVNQVVNDTALNIRGVGRSTVLADINSKDVLIASGMLEAGTGYYTYRDFYVDGPTAKTAVYYLNDADEKIHVRQFGSGLTMMQDRGIAEVGADTNGYITHIKLYETTLPTQDVIDRAVLDGIWLFHEQIGSTTNEDAYDSAFMWLKVTSVVQSSGGNVQFNVETTNLAADVTAGSGGDYVMVRGGCSDMTVTFMQMFYGRLFAAAHRSNADHPRRLYWSCLPGDGRTIEDWTQTDASVDTSGGHVDIGDPSDGYITGLVACGAQLLIFTQTRLWRLYGTAPSNYTLELIAELGGVRVSNPVDINGTVYWLSMAGVQYFNGSYISTVDDDGSVRNLLESFPQNMRDTFMYSTVHAVCFDNSIMFAFDATAHRTGLATGDEINEALLLRIDLDTWNTILYRVPCDRFRQQFIDVITRNFGVDGGNNVQYETRLIQTLVHKGQYIQTSETSIPESMTVTQWHSWGSQDFGWWDGSSIESIWQAGWSDMQTPDAVKKAHTICLRGSGEFKLTIESEVNKDVIEVKMPDNEYIVEEITPHHAEGRSFRFTVESDRAFEIEPYATIIFETGGKR